jgi:hypothetical protein
MSNNPTSENLTFLALIEKHKIEIPIIQRDYAQGREGKEDLRTEFLNALLKAINDKHLELDFVYGSVTDNTFQPLDGQQRLTTLFLLHWYIATKESRLDEFKELLTKFTYETRTSSREFCNDLINKGVEFVEGKKISERIIDSAWFFLSWKKDPTIKSMLTMLDAIHQTFKNTTEVWENLKQISFHYIELGNFGLSDDLYIKMNARGKALTPFENFKAKFEQYIKQVIYKTDENKEEIFENGEKIILKDNWENETEKPTDTFSHKIDTTWTDFFWNYKNDNNIFDEQFLNFFRTMAVINYALIEDIKSDDFRANIDLLRGNSKTISFNKYRELDCFDENYFTTIKAVLDKISHKNGVNKFLADSPYINEEELFNGVIKNDLSYPDLVTLFAFYKYLALEDDINTEKLKNWMRIVHNLVEGSRLYLFNNANDFANALRSISKLLEHRNSIIEYFAEKQDDSLSGFTKEQVAEEKLKATLILQSIEWKNAIIEIENHGYFKGQIGFLLDWCKDENSPENLDKFIKYTEKAEAIFDKDDLKKFDNHLLERALLATGDYMLRKGSNYSFLINKDRDISWKRLLRDDNDKRNILKSLIDKISVSDLAKDLQTIIKDLQEIIDAFTDKNDWRYYFIKQPEMIAACGDKNKFIRRNSESNILLLHSTVTSGYHKEYYSYSLFIELKNPEGLKDEQYKPQRSVGIFKYFECGDKQVAFDANSEKYIWTKNSDWVNKQEFENRDNAISELTK